MLFAPDIQGSAEVVMGAEASPEYHEGSDVGRTIALPEGGDT